VQGAAYANFAMQQAKYKNRQDEQARVRQEQTMDMQKQRLAIERFRAETAHKFGLKEIEDRRKRVTRDEWAADEERARLSEQDMLRRQEREHGRAQERETGARTKRLDTAAETQLTAVNKREDRKLDIAELRETRLKSQGDERNRIRGEQEASGAPEDKAGIAVAHDLAYQEAFEKIIATHPNWSRLSNEKLRVLTNQALDQADLRIATFVKLYNDKIDANRAVTADGILMPGGKHLSVASFRGDYRSALDTQGSLVSNRMAAKKSDVVYSEKYEQQYSREELRDAFDDLASPENEDKFNRLMDEGNLPSEWEAAIETFASDLYDTYQMNLREKAARKLKADRRQHLIDTPGASRPGN
jgi:hypothetical protein